MVLQQLSILHFKNIVEAQLAFAPKLNCFVGLNGQGKTNILDAIYVLSFTKSAYNAIDSMNIEHGQEMAMVQGWYDSESEQEPVQISCGIKRGRKKQFRKGKKDYERLIDHVGLIPLVMVSPQDGALIEDGSEERRRFLDSVISQCDKDYLHALNKYNVLLKQRNALLKSAEENPQANIDELLEVYEIQMVPLAEMLFAKRTDFVAQFCPLFEEMYRYLSGNAEQVSLRYVSQLQDRDLAQAMVRTRERDKILGWTSQGVHKDELEMLLDEYVLKRVASQGQQKTYLLAMKLAQALYLGKPILLLDDIFDKLDKERVARIVELVHSERFGQIFITDTDRQHLTELLSPKEDAKIFYVENGMVK